MILRYLKIGELFLIGRGKTIWKKDTEQGMNHGYSHCSSIDLKKTKNPSVKTRWNRLFSQDIKVIKHEDRLLYLAF